MKKNKLLFLFIVCTSFGFSQEFTYKRQIENVDSTWHEIHFSFDLLSKLNAGLSDVRIYSEAKNGDSSQVPYLIRKEEVVDSLKTNNLRTLSTTRIGDYYQLVFESNSPDYINSILVDFNDGNYDWNIEVLGSDDRNDWQYLARDYRILAIKNERARFAYNRIYFPKSKYKYYRVHIPTKRYPRILNIRSLYSISSNNKLEQIQKFDLKKKENKELKQTEITLDFGKNIPLSYLNFKFDDELNFFRRATIAYLSDSVKTANGEWKEIYSSFAYTLLSSSNKNELYFNERTVRKIKITIENNDNLPLKLNDISAKYYKKKIIARFPTPGRYFLYYGNKNMPYPDYDINRFEHKIPTKLSILTLGNEEIIPREIVNSAPPLFENKWWLYGIMGIIILLLGLFTFKMIKTK